MLLWVDCAMFLLQSCINPIVSYSYVLGMYILYPGHVFHLII